MQIMLGWEEAIERRARNVFSAKGQPQWRRKAMMVGFPGAGGLLSWAVVGAREPIVGRGALDREGGKAQEESS